ncbi:DNA replication/repair protein RecF [Colwellia sp. UCD-KL20]|uniref:DNA replication/repair protein RecF n=1 Tax=Colwellia sp. UCD-KL20 TaxID=1917165 RepID=UPI0009705484|nr:DNA replication/repair protein RecF [Colwellia sp. UCD-KL20]
MSVVRLITSNFRNIEQSQTELHSQLNFLVGDNGSGKSSFLEALFFLGHGKSFRTTKIENLVSYQESTFVVSIKDDLDSQIGISKNIISNETEIKINGIKQSKLSELAKNIAVQIITPESFKLFFGGPKERRRFIDLGLFHVEQSFSKAWKDFSRILKQRNAYLRSGANLEGIKYWDEAFCTHSNIVSTLRLNYVNGFREEFSYWAELLLPKIHENIEVQYFQGWKQNTNLADVLVNNRTREINLGYSISGTHKFDVRFIMSKQPLENQLSRGQQKLFLFALTFAQAKLIEKVKRVKPILLIDDVGAELDSHSRTVLNEAINQLNCQVIITAIDKSAVEPLVPSDHDYKMFHVKHGKIFEMSE